jgi:hypothetical protein
MCIRLLDSSSAEPSFLLGAQLNLRFAEMNLSISSVDWARRVNSVFRSGSYCRVDEGELGTSGMKNLMRMANSTDTCNVSGSVSTLSMDPLPQ